MPPPRKRTIIQSSPESSDDDGTRRKRKVSTVPAKKLTRLTSPVGALSSGTTQQETQTTSSPTRASKRLAVVVDTSKSNSSTPTHTPKPPSSPVKRPRQTIEAEGSTRKAGNVVTSTKQTSTQKKPVVRGRKPKVKTVAAVVTEDDTEEQENQEELHEPDQVSDESESIDADDTIKGHVLEHILRAHSRSTHDGQDEVDTDVWAVAFQPTHIPQVNDPPSRHFMDNKSDSDKEMESDEEKSIMRKKKRQFLAKDMLRQSKMSSSIAATCGGNTVCLIDCRLGRVMAKYSHVEEEEFMCLAWTTLNHSDLGYDVESRPGTKSRKAEGGQDGTAVEAERLEQSNILAAAGASMDGTARLWDIGSLSGYETEACCIANFVGLDNSSVTAIGLSEKYLIVGTEQGLMAQYNLFELNDTIGTRTTSDKRTLSVKPEKIYPRSQEWHESSIDDIVYIPHFSEKSYASILSDAGSQNTSKARKNTSKAQKGDRSKVTSGRDDLINGEFVFASRESCQGEIIVWEASKSTAKDAALKTILEWSIAESWTKFTLAENSAPEPKKAKTGRKGAQVQRFDERRQNILVGGSTKGSIVLYDLARKPKKARDGNIIAQKPSRIISNTESTQLLRDIAVSQDLSMMIAGDWSNRVLVWNYHENSAL
ncbi:Leucine-rich repeats and WD repeat domain-containing protein 1 [Mortierella sp. GBA30]|nr:Leucine-rich repeats and WD repeat domain-containing protein 1 [Mortierella sp. GBA30]